MTDLPRIALARLPKPDDELIKFLEDLLATAKRGEVLGLVVAADQTEGTVMTYRNVHKGGSHGALLLALEKAKLRLVEAAFE